jgi:diguanylate cyclase (GGDEF)-like protein/PAS domain S-box-containing protein
MISLEKILQPPLHCLDDWGVLLLLGFVVALLVTVFRHRRISRELARQVEMLEETERSLLDSKAVYAKLSKAVDQSPASIVITDRDGSIEYTNPAFSRLTGYEPEEVAGQNPRVLKGGEQDEQFYRQMWATLTSGHEWRGEFHNKRKDGSLFWEFASISPILDDAGEITHYVAVKEDITEKKQLLDRLDQMAHFDELTGLPNRALFMDRLKQAVAMSRRDNKRFALLYLDLDGFKRINDTYGHDAGDRVLKTVAARLSTCVRMSDTIGRMGGDEFTVILSTIAKHDDAGYVAEKIVAALNRSFRVSNEDNGNISVSIGISVFPDDATDGNQLITNADDAMYEVKHSGKNSYRFYGAAAIGNSDLPEVSD